MLLEKHYEIFLANGSPVTERETEQEALEYAEQLSMEHIDEDVVVTLVTEVIIKKYRNGGEVA